MGEWRTLHDLNTEEQCKDYDQALDVLENVYNASEDLACWRTELAPVADIDSYQIIDDPGDDAGWRKAGALQEALRRNSVLPPIVLAHTAPSARGSYGLLDGRHRFNAAHLEGQPFIRAWVAHIGCCGGPASNR
ncbi:ParB N-terminal domain-containing protein [Streptomyces sp. NPDC048362]|uniref:ParB N-terminal domain-containing protein n=1 Tax=Streptomyces sp. NPDC048362 TaxID=3365539 RepID=UPI0037178F95